MYFVINISNPPRVVVISDLGLTLGPRKSVDLEKTKGLRDIEKSQDLRTAVKHRLVQVRQSVKAKKEPKVKEIIKETGLNDKDIGKIRDIIKEEVGKSSHTQSQPELLQVLQQLTKTLESQKDRPVLVQTLDKSGVTDEQISDEKLAEIHARAVKHLASGAEAHVNYQQRNEDTGSSIDEKADELDKLLGE
jgi:phosphopentomutase